jgi:hypothetical protein
MFEHLFINHSIYTFVSSFIAQAKKGGKNESLWDLRDTLRVSLPSDSRSFVSEALQTIYRLLSITKHSTYCLFGKCRLNRTTKCVDVELEDRVILYSLNFFLLFAISKIGLERNDPKGTAILGLRHVSNRNC